MLKVELMFVHTDASSFLSKLRKGSQERAREIPLPDPIIDISFHVRATLPKVFLRADFFRSCLGRQDSLEISPECRPTPPFDATVSLAKSQRPSHLCFFSTP
jgi:hypothetical protein